MAAGHSAQRGRGTGGRDRTRDLAHGRESPAAAGVGHRGPGAGVGPARLGHLLAQAPEPEPSGRGLDSHRCRDAWLQSVLAAGRGRGLAAVAGLALGGQPALACRRGARCGGPGHPRLPDATGQGNLAILRRDRDRSGPPPATGQPAAGPAAHSGASDLANQRGAVPGQLCVRP